MPRRTNKLGKSRGFTLIEVAFSVAILAGEVIVLFSLIVSGMVQTDVTQEFDIARNAAVSKLEEIRGFEFTEVFLRYNTDLSTFPVYGLKDHTNFLVTARGSVTVQDNEIDDLFYITVTIRWKVKDVATQDPNTYNEIVSRSLLAKGAKY